MKLRWVKVSDGIWVDRDAFYCIRYVSASRHDWADCEGRCAYEASETYPGCPVEPLGAALDLPAAKALCQAHSDELFDEEAA